MSSHDQVPNKTSAGDTVAWGIGALAPSGKQGQEAPISRAPAKPHQ
jgi:hypothetical protein